MLSDRLKSNLSVPRPSALKESLKAPLKMRPPRAADLRARLPRLRFFPTLAMVMIALAVFSVLYARMMGDPLGGEPEVFAMVENADTRSAEAAGAEGLRTNATAEEERASTLPRISSLDDENRFEETATGARIITIQPNSAEPASALRGVPDGRLVERTRNGILPMVAADGTRPMDVYARPSDAPDTLPLGAKPRIAILINGMGLNTVQTREAIRRMPADVTLSFAPYANNLQDWVSGARQDGHEVMIQVPLEPFDYPENDPGPHTLLSSLTPAENLERLHWLMGRMVGYTGLSNYMGARFTASRPVLRPMLLELKKRGLLYIEDGASPRSLAGEIANEIGLPMRTASVVLDALPTPDAITTAIGRLEIEAHRNGHAIGVISALPVSIEIVSDWLAQIDDAGFNLVPVSATTRMTAEGES